MNLILDTHVFIWWTLTPEKLSSTVINLINNDYNRLLLSIASIWEMQIKITIGKLYFDKSLSDIVGSQRNINDVQILPVELEHIWQLDNLPLHHKDPFDRMLIAQAISENIPILSIDSVFYQYPVQIIW